ncbi:MAG: hypothetical protein H6883_14955, partial [Rhodobiaceae bacterium]|nr:hypothetical protein [Rhodobiaceae bacterium]
MSIFSHLMTGLRDLAYARSVPHTDLRRRLTTTVVLTVFIDIAATALMLLVEREHPSSDIHTLWDAFYFTTTQMTTLSSPMANPVTGVGQLIVLALDVYAITIVSTLAG